MLNIVITSDDLVFVVGKKKDLYPRRNTHWIKVLLAIYIVSRSESFDCVDGHGISHVSG